jgi:hypothetical protein
MAILLCQAQSDGSSQTSAAGATAIGRTAKLIAHLMHVRHLVQPLYGFGSRMCLHLRVGCRALGSRSAHDPKYPVSSAIGVCIVL